MFAEQEEEKELFIGGASRRGDADVEKYRESGCKQAPVNRAVNTARKQLTGGFM